MGTPISHLKLFIYGGYLVPALSGEQWQTGVSIYPSLTGMEPITTMSPDFELAFSDQSESKPEGQLDTNFILEGGITDIDPASWLYDQVRVAVDATFSGTTFSGKLAVTEVVTYAFDSDGKVIDDGWGPAKASFVWDAPVAGGDTASILPPQNTNVVSLRSAATNRRGRGRMYLPTFGVGQLTSEGVLRDTYRDGLASVMATFLNGVEFDTVDPGKLQVAIITSTPPITTAYQIAAIQVGNVVDTQRRRRNQLDEQYVSEPVTADRKLPLSMRKERMHALALDQLDEHESTDEDQTDPEPRPTD